jgi:phosphotransferase system  glucose/maltose/N-acetylglucosamine-specific IIC component
METTIIIFMVIVMILVLLFWHGIGRDITDIISLLKDIRNTLQEIEKRLKR